MHQANRRRWELASPHYSAWRDDGWRKCLADPSLGFERGSLQLLRQYVGHDLVGKTACVLGSGDSYAVFALAGMGAQVTSVDISQAQLDVAAERAAELGVVEKIRELRPDVVILDADSDGQTTLLPVLLRENLGVKLVGLTLEDNRIDVYYQHQIIGTDVGDLIEAVREKKFGIWAVETIEQGLEVLSGTPAGARGEDGSYPEGSVLGRADRKLADLAEQVRQFGPADVASRQ